jgi:hypothetical protein
MLKQSDARARDSGLELRFAADWCPCVEKLRTVSPLTWGGWVGWGVAGRGEPAAGCARAAAAAAHAAPPPRRRHRRRRRRRHGRRRGCVALRHVAARPVRPGHTHTHTGLMGSRCAAGFDRYWRSSARENHFSLYARLLYPIPALAEPRPVPQKASQQPCGAWTHTHLHPRGSRSPGGWLGSLARPHAQPVAPSVGATICRGSLRPLSLNAPAVVRAALTFTLGFHPLFLTLANMLSYPAQNCVR